MVAEVPAPCLILEGVALRRRGHRASIGGLWVACPHQVVLPGVFAGLGRHAAIRMAEAVIVGGFVGGCTTDGIGPSIQGGVGAVKLPHCGRSGTGLKGPGPYACELGIGDVQMAFRQTGPPMVLAGWGRELELVVRSDSDRLAMRTASCRERVIGLDHLHIVEGINTVKSGVGDQQPFMCTVT